MLVEPFFRLTGNRLVKWFSIKRQRMILSQPPAPLHSCHCSLSIIKFPVHSLNLVSCFTTLTQNRQRNESAVFKVVTMQQQGSFLTSCTSCHGFFCAVTTMNTRDAHSEWCTICVLILHYEQAVKYRKLFKNRSVMYERADHPDLAYCLQLNSDYMAFRVN